MIFVARRSIRPVQHEQRVMLTKTLVLNWQRVDITKPHQQSYSSTN
jgi:hypothetical protein